MYLWRLSIIVALTSCLSIQAQNPFITEQFTADPSARVMNGKVYVFPSHDIQCSPPRGREKWFCMEDYHVYSSDNLTEWKDHGVIVNQYDVPWANTDSYSMWAPDCIERNDKYFFYFPTQIKDTTKYGNGFSIGVAIADKPEGPYRINPEPIAGVKGIDPNVFIDKDDQAYLYWSSGNIYVAKLKDNMTELASEPKIIDNLPTEGLKEGPYLFERNGNYYLTYPHVANKTERLEYAMGKSPEGPFKVTGVIMDESPTGCWTNHHSILDYKEQWYLFYHHNDLSPDFDKNRSIRLDSLSFNTDGTIKKVIPTLRGVGLSDAFKPIQIDRYSEKSDNVNIEFLTPLERKKGWKVLFNKAGSWVRYNQVSFSSEPTKIMIQALSKTGGTIEVFADSRKTESLVEIKIPKSIDWQTVTVDLDHLVEGIHDLFIEAKNDATIDIDWIKFE